LDGIVANLDGNTSIVSETRNLKRLWDILLSLLDNQGLDSGRFTTPNFGELAGGISSEKAHLGVALLAATMSSNDKQQWMERMGHLDEEDQLQIIQIMHPYMNTSNVPNQDDDLREHLHNVTLERNQLALVVNQQQESSRVTKQISALVQKCEELEQLLAESEDSRTTLQSQLHQLNQLNQLNQLKNLKSPVNNSSPTQSLTSTKEVELRNLVQQHLVEKRRLENDLIDSKEQVDDLQLQIKELVSKCEILETQWQSSQIHIPESESQDYIQDLEQTVEHLQSKVESLTADLDDLASQLSHAKQTQQGQMQNVKSDERKLLDALEEAQEQLASQDQVILKQQTKIKELHSYSQTLKQQLSEFLTQPTNNPHLETTIQEQQLEIDRLRKHVAHEKAQRLQDGLDPRLLARLHR
jgi:predicted  nucleic acid-binding Zn-ribbon protein